MFIDTADRSPDLDAAAHAAAEANALYTCGIHRVGMYPRLAVIRSPWTGKQIEVPMGALPADMRLKIDNAAGGTAEFTKAELAKVVEVRQRVQEGAKRANVRMHCRLMVRRGRYGR